MNILFGSVLSSMLTFAMVYFQVNKNEHVDKNSILMYFIVYAIPIIISAIVINLIINMFFEREKLKPKIFMVMGLLIIFYAFSNLVTTQYDYLLKLISFPFFLSSIAIIFLNFKKIKITK